MLSCASLPEAFAFTGGGDCRDRKSAAEVVAWKAPPVLFGFNPVIAFFVDGTLLDRSGI